MDSSRTWSNKSDDADDRVADCEDRPEDCYRLAVANIICCIHVGRVHVLDFCSHFSSPALTSLLFPSLTLEKSPFFAKTIVLCDADNNFTMISRCTETLEALIYSDSSLYLAHLRGH